MKKSAKKTKQQAPRMFRVITTSPLARIFNPYFKVQPLLEAPELINRHPAAGFNVMIEGSWETKEFRSGEVYLLDEVTAQALVGIDNSRFRRDTNWTGLVYLQLPDDLSAALDYKAKTGADLGKDMQARLDEAMRAVETASHKRVLLHCKTLYNSLVASRNKLKENGLEASEPNDMELLVAFILREEVQKASARRAKLKGSFAEAEAAIGTGAAAAL